MLTRGIAHTDEILARVRDYLPILRSSSTSWWEETDWNMHLSVSLPLRPQEVEVWPQEIKNLLADFSSEWKALDFTPRRHDRSKHDLN